MKDPSERSYRRIMARKGLFGFGVRVRETDLWVQAESDLSDLVRELVLKNRAHLEGYIENNPGFVETLVPWAVTGPAPPIVRAMVEAGAAAGTGPMAAVAGAIAEAVGKPLLSRTRELIVENGGDIFLSVEGPVTVGIFAGESPLSNRVGVRLEGAGGPFAVCTSSGTVGPSLSLGRADAAVVVSKSCPLADAVATAVGNLVQGPGDVGRAVDFGRTIPGVTGLVVIAGDRMAAWGDLEVVPLSIKTP